MGDKVYADQAPSIPQLPRPPSPSADVGIVAASVEAKPESDSIPDSNCLDIFSLSPTAALKILCISIQLLVRITGDVPPTPPISHPSTPLLGITGVAKEHVTTQVEESSIGNPSEGGEDGDGVPTRAKTPIGSPEAHPTEPLYVIGSDPDPMNIQQGAIIRKFYSKKPPPIDLEEYLLRLHRYCPMSTAVYLATSLYIHRLAVVEKTLAVTARNVHRLVLAGLRVAMKALEDQSYPHRRFAKVGGVSEPELGRLEVSFCFVTNFELKVTKEGLLEHAKAVRDGTTLCNSSVEFQPRLPLPKNERSVVVEQTEPPTIIATEAPAAA